MSFQRRDIAAGITQKILGALEQGVMPWRRPWDGARAGVVLPRRVTGENYRGVNTIMLWNATYLNGYRSPYWLTFQQCRKLDAHVRRGERGEPVVFYGHAERKATDAEGAETVDTYRFLRCYTAFNADQVDGLPERFHPQDEALVSPPIERHEEWFAALGIARLLTKDIACYIPSRDVIGMPPLAAFDTAEHYAATLNHEACHATAAPHRVGRDLSKRFDRAAVAAEELVAEIGASILGAHLGLPPHHIDNHASYISHWMTLLRDDRRAFLTAAAEAQRAVDWLLAASPIAEARHVDA